MKKRSLYSFCRNDLILAIVLAAAAGALFAGFFLLRGNAAGDVAVIRVNGQVYGTYPLTQDREIRIDTERGINVVQISSGEVWMQEADCPDSYCLSRGAVSQNGDTIVCLPHRVVVEVQKQERAFADYDTISQ